MKVIMSDESKADITQIFDYIASDSPKYAKITTQNIRYHIRSLKKFPYIGRYIPELVDEPYYKDYRELIYKSYRTIYHVYEDTNEIYILTIVHSARNFITIFNSHIKNFFYF